MNDTTTNDYGGFRYRPNIPAAGMLQVESADRQWVEFIAYGKSGNGYYTLVSKSSLAT